MSPSHIVMSTKSRWLPAIRREHSLARTLVENGRPVDVVERSYDVRDLKPGGARPAPDAELDLLPGLSVTSYFAPVPGHRSRSAHLVDSWSLRRTVRRLTKADGPPSASVVTTPWNWQGATRGLPSSTRKVLDLGDDWAALIPQRRELIESFYRRVSDEADAIIVVTPTLASCFDRPVTVVPNAVAPELLRDEPVAPPDSRRMAYVGTLSERLDVELLHEVMGHLGDWSLDLYGPCRYAGRGEEPSDELEQLLADFADRVAWHGPVSRADQAAVLDRADVLILPNDPVISLGQDPMKLYDYAARGRPIVSTPIQMPASTPRDLVVAEGAEAFAARVAEQRPVISLDNRAWAEEHGWDRRIGPWLDAATPDEPLRTV